MEEHFDGEDFENRMHKSRKQVEKTITKYTMPSTNKVFVVASY